MNYWKLGCNWGHGAPDFYSLLKEKQIVICGDSPMAKGDWVLICQGHDAVALAKIESVPVLSTARVDLQADFARLQITYDETNSVANAAEFYELTESERFQYQLQQGICRINNPEIRGTIECILTDREKNKMITQATKLLKSKKNVILQRAPGTGDIIARCREWGLPDPQWQIEDDDDFVMVMPRLQSSVKSVDKTVDWTVDKTVDWTVDKTADGSTNERILNLLVTNPRATQEELARVLGLSVRGIEYAIGTLKKAKRIRKVGGKRFGHWEVIA